MRQSACRPPTGRRPRFSASRRNDDVKRRDLLRDVERKTDAGNVFHAHRRFALPAAPTGRQPNRGHFLLRGDGRKSFLFCEDSLLASTPKVVVDLPVPPYTPTLKL